jgi:hypothetical protein
MRNKTEDLTYVKMARYFLKNFKEVKKTSCHMRSLWRDEKYKCAGKQHGELILDIIEFDDKSLPAVAKTMAMARHDNMAAMMAQLMRDATPEELSQEFLNGFFTEFDLPEPKTVLQCFPATLQKEFAEFVPELLDRSCGMQLRDLREIIDLVKAFADKVPDSVCACLEKNKEAAALHEKLPEFDVQVVIRYVTTHFRKVQRDVCEMKELWEDEEHRKVGEKSAELIKDIFDIDRRPRCSSCISPKEALTDYLNGFFEGFDLPETKTFMHCVPPRTQNDIYKYVPQMLDKVCSLKVKEDIKEVLRFAREFYEEHIPYSMEECLYKNEEAIALHKAMEGLCHEKVEEYYLEHFTEVRTHYCHLKQLWSAKEYRDAGEKAAEHVREIIDWDPEDMKKSLAPTKSVSVTAVLAMAPAANKVTPLEAEQQFLNGFYTQFDLPEPKTVMRCIPAQTQTDIYAFVPELLEKACGMKLRDVKELVESIREFYETIPESVEECLCANEEAEALRSKIGEVKVERVITYITTHFRKVQTEVCELKTLWHEEKHRNVGERTAVLLKDILDVEKAAAAMMMTKSTLRRNVERRPFEQKKCPKTDLQAFLRGFFLEFELEEPETLLKCLPEEAQRSLVEFAPELLEKICEMEKLEEIQEIIDFVNEYVDTLPESIVPCLDHNPDLEKLADKIGTVDLRRVIARIAMHFKLVRREVCRIKSIWLEDRLEEAGKASAALLKRIIDVNDAASASFNEKEGR